MFAKVDIRNLVQDAAAFKAVQDEANNSQHSNHLLSKMRLALAKIYGFTLKNDATKEEK